MRPVTPQVPRTTTPPVIGSRPTASTTPPANTAARANPVRAVRSVHPPVIGERTAPKPPSRAVDWQPAQRGPRGYTDQVLGRQHGTGIAVKPFSRTPSIPDGERLNRPVIGRRREPVAPRTASGNADDTWSNSPPTVDSVIGSRGSGARQVHHPGPVAFTASRGKALELEPLRGGDATDGGLVERLKRMRIQTVTGDRMVSARLTGTGDVSFSFGLIGTDMAALARAVRSAMLAALRGREIATARIVGEPVKTPSGDSDPLSAVDVEARSRLGYVHIRWRGRNDITVVIDSRARQRLDDDRLLSEVNHAAATVLRRHREHVIELNRRLVADAGKDEPR